MLSFKTVFFLLILTACGPINTQWLADLNLTNHPDSSLTSQNNARCINAQGNTVHVAWQDNRDGNYEIYYKRSTDDGANWSPETRLTSDNAVSQRPAIALSGQYVHIAWNDRVSNEEIYYKRSTDGGVTWGANLRLTNDPNLSTYPSISSSGSIVVVSWSENRDGNYEIYYKLSTDNGGSWGADTRFTNDGAVSLQPCVSVSGQIVHITWHDNRNANDEIYYRRSTNGGVTWEAEVRLTTLPGTSFFASSYASGQYVFTAWVENSDGNPEIYSKRSTDMGLTWEANVRQTNNLAISIRPTVTISGNNFYITWQDGVDGNDEIYYRSSTDAGITFSGITRLTNEPAISVYPCHAVSASGVHVVWRDFRDGNWEVYYKRNPSGNLVGMQNLSGEIPKRYSLLQNYPNPFNPTTSIEFLIPPLKGMDALGGRGVYATLEIFDAPGRKIGTLVNGELSPGIYRVDWDASGHASGIYFYRLVAGNISETKKMTLVK